MVDLNKCEYYLYDENYSQKENCTASGSWSMGNPPCHKTCAWYLKESVKEILLDESLSTDEKIEDILFLVEKKT